MIRSAKHRDRLPQSFHIGMLAMILLAFAAAAYPIASPAAYAPGTIGYALVTGCSQGRAALRDESAATDATNMGDFRRARRLNKKASDLWYGCSKETSSEYLHDEFLLAHDTDLASAAASDVDPWLVAACAQLNELSYATPFSDIREEALKAKHVNCQSAE